MWIKFTLIITLINSKLLWSYHLFKDHSGFVASLSNLFDSVTSFSSSLNSSLIPDDYNSESDEFVDSVFEDYYYDENSGLEDYREVATEHGESIIFALDDFLNGF